MLHRSTHNKLTGPFRPQGIFPVLGTGHVVPQQCRQIRARSFGKRFFDTHHLQGCMGVTPVGMGVAVRFDTTNRTLLFRFRLLQLLALVLLS